MLIFLTWLVIGCSNTGLSWGGLVDLEPTVSHSRGGAGGCNLRRFARHVRDGQGKCVDRPLAVVEREGYPQAIWLQVCISDDAVSPRPTRRQVDDYADVLAWVGSEWPAVPVYTSPLPPFDTGCKGGPGVWFGPRVAARLVRVSEDAGLTLHGPRLETMRFEDVRASDPDCEINYGGRCDDECHPNRGRIAEDGAALLGWLSKK